MTKRLGKAKIIPFDGNCQVCGRVIPKIFTYCGSKCRRKDLGIPTPKYMLSRKSIPVHNVERKKRITPQKQKKGQQRLGD